MQIATHSTFSARVNVYPVRSAIPAQISLRCDCTLTVMCLGASWCVCIVCGGPVSAGLCLSCEARAEHLRISDKRAIHTIWLWQHANLLVADISRRIEATLRATIVLFWHHVLTVQKKVHFTARCILQGG